MRSASLAVTLIVAACGGGTAEDASPPAPRVTVFIGDSITAEWGRTSLATSSTIINKGIGGQTSQAMLARFATDVLALRPAQVHILAGTNDVHVPGGSTDTSAVETMASQATFAGMRVILGTIPPIDPDLVDPSFVAAWNAKITAFAAAHGYTLINYHGAMILPDGSENFSLFRDRVHPNADGFAVMFALLSRAL